MYCIALHCIALHCIALHCIALHCIALHCIVLYCIVFLASSSGVPRTRKILKIVSISSAQRCFLESADPADRLHTAHTAHTAHGSMRMHVTPSLRVTGEQGMSCGHFCEDAAQRPNVGAGTILLLAQQNLGWPVPQRHDVVGIDLQGKSLESR